MSQPGAARRSICTWTRRSRLSLSCSHEIVLFICDGPDIVDAYTVVIVLSVLFLEASQVISIFCFKVTYSTQNKKINIFANFPFFPKPLWVPPAHQNVI
jgi:hypothetical protein